MRRGSSGRSAAAAFQREFREYGGERPLPLPQDARQPAEFIFGRLMYPSAGGGGFFRGGGGRDWRQGGRTNWTNDYPAADRHLMIALRRLTSMDVRSVEQPVNLEDGDDVFNWPFLFAGRTTAIDLTDDELAKLHIRHLVGGHSPLARDERIYRFEFPERPGALMRFLTSMSPNWNISLFHYRNHGADYGRILVGLQVPAAEKRQLRAFLDTLGYRHWDETDHPAYRLFLGAQL